MIKKRLQTQLRDLVQTFDDENGETFYWYKFVTQNKSTLHFLLGMHNGLHNFGKIIKQYYNKQIHNKVIISFGNESLYQFEDADLKPISIFKLLHRWADEANVPLAIIEFRNGNQSIAETYNAWCNDKGITQRLGYVGWYDVWASNTLRTHRLIDKKIHNHAEQKPLYYTFQNNKMRWHRLKLLEALYDNDLLEFGACSYIFSDQEKHINSNIVNDRDEILNLIPSSRDGFVDSKNTKYPTIINRAVEPMVLGGFMSYFNDSYYDFIPETTFEPHSYQHNTDCKEDYWNYTFYSEKTWRSIMFKRPFIMINTPGSLQKLKEHGFRTFDKWWDESYDTIDNAYKRIDALIKLNKHIIETYSLEQLHHIVHHEMKEVLDHNYNLLPKYAEKHKLQVPDDGTISLSYFSHPNSPAFKGFDYFLNNIGSYTTEDAKGTPEYLLKKNTH